MACYELRQVEFRMLGRTGVGTSVLGLGGNTFGAGVDQAATAKIIDRALDLGVNLIDTADSYSLGLSEEYIGRAIRKRRNAVLIATKTGARNLPPGRLSRRQILLSIDRSLRRLQTDRIDVYYAHAPDPGSELEETFQAFDDAVRAGKILYPAVSNYPAWQMAVVAEICRRSNWASPVVSQNAYNLLDRGVERELIPACQHYSMSLVPHTPLGGGFLTGKYQRNVVPPKGVRGHENALFQSTWLTADRFNSLHRVERVAWRSGYKLSEVAIAWLLTNPTVCSVIAGVTSVEQLEANVAACDRHLDSRALAELRAIS